LREADWARWREAQGLLLGNSRYIGANALSLRWIDTVDRLCWCRPFSVEFVEDFDACVL
jgi:hypothetical protein